MSVPVGLNVWSRLMEDTFPYLDQTAGPFDSLWFPDHVQYDGHKVAEGWSLLAYALARIRTNCAAMKSCATAFAIRLFSPRWSPPLRSSREGE